VTISIQRISILTKLLFINFQMVLKK